MPKNLFALVAVCFPLLAFADWIDPGVSYRCDPKNGSFELRALMDTSSGPAVALEPGFKKLPVRRKVLSCKITNVRVKAVVWVSPGSATGTCAAFGTIQVNLTVNGQQVVANELFNSGCFFDPVLYAAKVKASANTSNPEVVLCKGTWDWDDNFRYENGKCSVTVER